MNTSPSDQLNRFFALSLDELRAPEVYEKDGPFDKYIRNVVTTVVYALMDEDPSRGFGAYREEVRAGKHAGRVHAEIQRRYAEFQRRQRAAEREERRRASRRRLEGEHHGYTVRYDANSDLYLVSGPKNAAVNARLKELKGRWNNPHPNTWNIKGSTEKRLALLLEEIPHLRGDAERDERKTRQDEATRLAGARAAGRSLVEDLLGGKRSVIYKTEHPKLSVAVHLWQNNVSLQYPYLPAANAVMQQAGGRYVSGGYSFDLSKVDGAVIAAIKRVIEIAREEGTRRVAEEQKHRQAQAQARKAEQSVAVQPAEQPKDVPVAEPKGVIVFWRGDFGWRCAKGAIPDPLWRAIKAAGEVRYISREMADDMDHYPAMVDDRWDGGWFYTDASIDRLLRAGYHVQLGGVLATDGNWREALARHKEEKRQQEMARAALQQEMTRTVERIRAALQSAERPQPGTSEAAAFEADMESGRVVTTRTEASPVEHLTARTYGPSWSGPSLYGSGSWLVVTENYLYEVYQNSHDGDNWAESNTRHGITRRIPRTGEIDSALQALIRLTGQSEDLLA